MHHTLILLLASWIASPVATQEPSKAAPREIPPVADPVRFVTQHEGVFGGRTLAYTATAGETLVPDAEGEPQAAIFTFAYTVEAGDARSRPVTFVWNGGPGSSSVWLHMGAFGPRRVDTPSDAADDGAPPYDLEASPLTILDQTDLVFVDPVGTGYSRPVGSAEGKQFWGLEEDGRSIADFIRTWITENGRWASPKFLLGESFGTTRAAVVADLLEGDYGISLNGLVLVSQALDYEGSTPRHENFQSFVTYVPSMAATAWYHGKVSPKPPLEDFLDEVRAFTLDRYAPALLKGSSLALDDRAAIVRDLARYTGLSERYIELADLRINAWRFLKQLLRDDGVTLGRIDSRFVGDDIDDLAATGEGDPSGYGIEGAYTSALNSYLHDELDVRMDRPYKISGDFDGWSWKPEGAGAYWEPSYVHVGRRLGRAMRRNPDLEVLVTSGYYDFATPFFDAEVTFARHGIVPERVTMTYYEAGHMMYVHDPSREALMDDVRAFYRKVLGVE